MTVINVGSKPIFRGLRGRHINHKATATTDNAGEAKLILHIAQVVKWKFSRIHYINIIRTSIKML